MRCVVTGAAGFLGSHLTDRLLADGHEVIGIDSLITGSLDNIRHLHDHRAFHFSEADVTKYVFVNGAVDRIYHFASPASPRDFSRFPVHILKVGALGTLNALGLAKAKNARMLLASTSEIYGDPEVHPQREDYFGRVNTTGPRSMYDEAKRFAEALTTSYHNQNHVEARIVRIFNTYGPRMRLDDGRCLPNFILSGLKGEALTIFGDGRQTRSFCYVDDLIDGIVRLMESPAEGPVNIGNPEEITIQELAAEVIAMTGGRSSITNLPALKDDPVRRRPDITRARAVLNWEPKVHRAEGLQRAVADFRRRMGL
jgi:dTDP-glucose 4,6-dehydratase